MNELIKQNYNGFEIQFEMVDGKLMANATDMAKAFGKRPDAIFKTESWKDFEEALIDDLNLRVEDIRIVKHGDNGGSWIHQELIVEFARRINPKFALWCNRKIAELLRTGKVEIKPMSMEEIMIANLQSMIDVKKQIGRVEEKVKEIEAKYITSPTDYYTVAGYASLIGQRMDVPTAASIGKRVNAICKANGYPTGKVPDARFGRVNTYPKDALIAAFTVN